MTDGGDDRAGNENRSGNDSNLREPLAWATIEGDEAYRCPGFSIRHETVRLPDGTETDFDYLVEPPAVVILPFTADGTVVLIEEWRQAVGRVNRGLPAGTVEKGDADLEAAARRELHEETGYEAKSVEPLVTIEPANGVAASVHHYFLAEGCTPAGPQELDCDESIRTIETNYDAFRERVRSGESRDGRAVLGLAYYELLGESG